MKSFSIHKNFDPDARSIFILSSILIPIFLGFVDEGHYNFAWMSDFSSWIAFIIYGLFFFMGQYLVHFLLFKLYSGPGKILISIILGVIIGFLMVAKLIFGAV